MLMFHKKMRIVFSIIVVLEGLWVLVVGNNGLPSASFDLKSVELQDLLCVKYLEQQAHVKAARERQREGLEATRERREDLLELLDAASKKGREELLEIEEALRRFVQYKMWLSSITI